MSANELLKISTTYAISNQLSMSEDDYGRLCSAASVLIKHARMGGLPPVGANKEVQK